MLNEDPTIQSKFRHRHAKAQNEGKSLIVCVHLISATKMFLKVTEAWLDHFSGEEISEQNHQPVCRHKGQSSIDVRYNAVAAITYIDT